MSRRVGIDLVSPESVIAAINGHGDRYLRRVFTAREREGCRRGDTLDPRRLAACVAAKEATFKAIGVGDRAVAWTDVEVARSGPCSSELMLSGQTATLAKNEGISGLSLSLVPAGTVAAAVVIAVIDSGSPVVEVSADNRRNWNERKDPQGHS
jgi:holo-[acyl-carrier protein] synthase